LYVVIPVYLLFAINSIQVNPRYYKSEVITYCLVKTLEQVELGD